MYFNDQLQITSLGFCLCAFEFGVVVELCKIEHPQVGHSMIPMSHVFPAMIPGDRSKPPENFRQLSVIPTPSDITDRSHDRDPSVRKNKIKGRYYNEEHYLDVQFRLFREDFLRPLRDGIQQLIGMPNNSGDDSDEHLQNIRNYEHVRILNTVCTSTGIRYRIRFDVSKFAGLQWENSKRLIFGSLLCLSKDNFKTFVFATVADRVLENVKQVTKTRLQ